MAKHKPVSGCIDDLNLLERRKFFRGLCPCRTNSSTDLNGWRELFAKARFGSYSERRSAAHSIGTLLAKAQKVDDYRELLKDLQCDLDELMQDPRSASQVLGVMKKHGHAHKGAARKNFRRAYAVFTMQKPEEVADWLNTRMRLQGKRRVTTSSTVVKRLAKWLKHRTAFQPNRKTSEEELLDKTRQLMPSIFA